MRSSGEPSKKILAISGSHRDGSTSLMLSALLKEIDPDHKKEIMNLRELDIGMCTGDDRCVDNKVCHIKDDFDTVVSRMQDADIIIFASPSYFNNVTAVMKNFIDRCNVLWNSQQLKGKGKKAVLCAIGGGKNNHIEGCLKALRNLCGGINIEVMAQLMVEQNNIDASMSSIKNIGEKINGYK